MTESNSKPLDGFQASGVATFFALSRTGVDAMLQWSDLFLRTMRRGMDPGEEGARKALAATAPQDWFAAQAALMEPAAECMRDYMQQSCEIALNTRATIEKTLQSQFEASSRSLSTWFETSAQDDGSAAQPPWNPWQSAFASTMSLYEIMQRAMPASSATDSAGITNVPAVGPRHKSDPQAGRAVKA